MEYTSGVSIFMMGVHLGIHFFVDVAVCLVAGVKS